MAWLRPGGEAGGLAGQEKSALIQKRSETRTYFICFGMSSTLKRLKTLMKMTVNMTLFWRRFEKLPLLPILTRKECFQNVLITRFSVHNRKKRIKNQYVFIRKHFSVAGP